MEILAKLFGGEARVKIMRLFLFNYDITFDAQTIADKVKEDVAKVRKELGHFERMNLLKKKTVQKLKSKNGKKGVSTSYGFSLNKNFEYLTQLQNFLINAKPLQPKEILRKVMPLGAIKLVLVSGVFIQDDESRVDLFVVGDNIKKSQFEHLVHSLEAEIGKELKYSYFSTTDFNYRFSMYDKLIRDILESPHEKLINKLPLLS
jgi:hypothetical protein